jgi:hypothetical protein
MARNIAAARYGPRPAGHLVLDGVLCPCQRVAIDELVEWRQKRRLRPVRAIPGSWPPIVVYERIPHAEPTAD